jgi:NADP-dependent 3-hydroxy acid dehydrogenase YdfG
MPEFDVHILPSAEPPTGWANPACHDRHQRSPCHRSADRQTAASVALQHRKQELNMSKVWFITGAGSGIGAATARAAMRAGDRAVATGRNLDKVRNALRGVPGDNLALVQLDVTNEAQARSTVDAAIKAFGRIDVLVNNAGYSLLGNFEELSTVEIEQLLGLE